MTKCKKALVLSLAVFQIFLVACGGGSGNHTSLITVTISNPPASVVVGTTATFTAVVSNDGTGAGVTWTVTCGSSSCGSVTPASSTGNSSMTSYTAPSSVPTGNKVTITATSAANSAKSASVSVTITPPPIISVTISNPPTSMVVGTSAVLTANVSEDSKAAGVTWTVTCGSSSCGSFNPATASGNTATTTFTAPGAIPTGNTVTVTATSVTDKTKSASATITITGPVVADGNYVFQASGQDTNGPYFVAGVFTLSKAAITGGEQDYIDLAAGAQNTIVAASSSLTFASDGNFQLVLATGNANLGANGVETFRGTLVSGTHAEITEFDSSAAAAGTLDLQTSTAAPSGGYAFNLGGVDGSANANPLFIGGVITINGTSIATANSEFDYFDGGAVAQGESFASGTVTAPDSLGRLAISLTPTEASGGVEFSLVGYTLSSGRIQLVESPSDTLGGTVGGTALGQASNAGNFLAAGVGGSTYVFMARGEDLLNGTATFAGTFVLNSGGTVSGSLAYNDITFSQNLTITGGNWAVDALGRVALNNITANGSSIGNGPFAFQLYLDGNGNALELGSDTIQGSAGPAYLQTATQQITSGNYAIRAQGFANTQNQPDWAAAGAVMLDSSLNWSGFTDYHAFGQAPAATVALSGITNTTTGLFSIAGLNAVSPPPVTPEFAYFQIDNSSALAIEMDNGQSGAFILETITQ